MEFSEESNRKFHESFKPGINEKIKVENMRGKKKKNVFGFGSGRRKIRDFTGNEKKKYWDTERSVTKGSGFIKV